MKKIKFAIDCFYTAIICSTTNIPTQLNWVLLSTNINHFNGSAQAGFSVHSISRSVFVKILPSLLPDMVNLTSKPAIALFCRTVTRHSNSRIWFSHSPPLLGLSLAGKTYITVKKIKMERNLKLHCKRYFNPSFT
jgi:hypothetical protein